MSSIISHQLILLSLFVASVVSVHPFIGAGPRDIFRGFNDVPSSRLGAPSDSTAEKKDESCPLMDIDTIRFNQCALLDRVRSLERLAFTLLESAKVKKGVISGVLDEQDLPRLAKRKNEFIRFG